MKEMILDFSAIELKQKFIDAGIKGYRALQVNQWILRGVESFEEMNNIPKELQAKLTEDYIIGLPKIASIAVSKLDGTRKYVLEMFDGRLIECVLMRYYHGLTVCISSQVGCRMGCTFCASTGIGFERNLSCGEMLAQIIVMQKDAGERISNVVIMGIGEPMDNFENLIQFLRLVNDKDGLNIGFRHVTVSTCGLVKNIIKLAEVGNPVNLSVSLHATNDALRSSIMPVNKSDSIDKLMHGCKIYIEKTKRRVTFEYALIKGFNDSQEEARKLARLLKGLMCMVNVIPINEVSGTGFEKSSRKSIEGFVDTLEKEGIVVTVRRELGSDISAACGQLRKDSLSLGDNE